MKVTFLHNGYESLAIEALSASLKAKGFKTSLVIDPALFDESGFWKHILTRNYAQLLKSSSFGINIHIYLSKQAISCHYNNSP